MQELFWQLVHDLIQDGIAWPDVLQKHNQITKALTITQLTEHHCKQLIPAGKMLHVAITIILANVVVKLSSVQKSSKLSKNVFVLEHSSQLYLAAKLQNQVRFISKPCLID